MSLIDVIRELQMILNTEGANPPLTVDGVFGPKTEAALKKALAPKPIDGVKPIYPKQNPFHPIFKVPEGYTHLHPIDVLRSVAGEKEIYGSKDNPLIAHFHEHSGNLGTHSDGADYHDEVPHCSSALNWAADMSGCRKTNNALAASWKKYNNPREGDWVEEGDIITIGTSHVTMCNRRCNRRSAKVFEGFGSNQGNTIKTSSYVVSSLSSVQMWEPLPGTILAPIGTEPVEVSGTLGEGTR